MDPDGSDPLPRTAAAPPPTDRRPGRWPRLILPATGLFALSTAFPIVAGLLPADRVPAWLGVVDVALAAVVMVLAIGISSAAPQPIPDAAIHRSYRIYRQATSLLLILIVVFFVVGEQIRWGILLPGLAWRAWAFCYSLPAALALRDSASAR